MDTRKTGEKALSDEVLDFIFTEDMHDADPFVNRIVELEDERQIHKIILIASESMCPLAIRRAMSSNFVNIYAEGYPSYRLIREIQDSPGCFSRQLSFLRRYSDRRYYKGVEYVDFIEALAQKRAAQCFATVNTPAEEIFVNVQPLSGAAANNAVYEAFLKCGDTVMGMDLTHGGHLTHGSHANRSGKNYHIVSYHANYETGEIEYDNIYTLAQQHRPKLIIAGYSAYPRSIDWKRFREIADSVGAVLLADISHPAGLVVGQCFPSPVDYADVTTFTTHKTMCGPRGAVILTTSEEKGRKIDNAVFPGEQGGPHINSIAAKAILFKFARTEKFKTLQQKVLKNSRELAENFSRLGLKLAYGGTDSHMSLIDIRNIKGANGSSLKGEIASRILDLCGITCNKNTIPGDDNAAHPGALRFGTTWVTQRGFGSKEIRRLAEIIHKNIMHQKPFSYLEAQGDVGRAKIPLEILEETQKEVQELLSGLTHGNQAPRTGFPHYYHLREEKSTLETPLLALHQEGKAKLENIGGMMLPLYYRDPREAEEWEAGTHLVDESDAWLMEIWGERSQFFLEEITTCDMLSLLPHHSRHTFILNDEGKILDDVIIFRLESPGDGIDRYVIRTNAMNGPHLLSLLRALSDGYVLFDHKDLYSKIQGPVVIEALRDCEDRKKRLISLGLYGKEADSVLKALKIAPPSRGGSVTARVGEITVTVVDPGYGERRCGYMLLLNPQDGPALWKELMSGGKGVGLNPAGVLLREKVRLTLGLPDYRNSADGRTLYQKGFKAAFAVSKPYFLGQKALCTGLEAPASKHDFVFEEKEETPLTTCLFEEHKKLTNKLVPFAGYTMPVWYTSINEEHLAVRKAAGLFDVSHMGVLEFKGRDATRFLDCVTTNYVTKLRPGQSQYSYMLDSSGNVLDDVMVYRRGQDRYMVIVNAANAKKIKSWIQGLLAREFTLDRDLPHKELSVELEFRDLKDESCGLERRVDVALQGPKSLDILCALIPDTKGKKALRKLNRNEFIETELMGRNLIISRTGYTGEEIGFELYLHPNDAVAIWKGLLAEGKQCGLIPAGLGSRDSTRTEAGLPLYGHELAGTYNITPHEAGYGSFVKFHKPFFIGRSAIIDKEAKREMEIIRFKMLARGIKIVKQGDPLVTRKGDCIGAVTSCVPIEGIQWGLAYVKKRYAQPNTRIGVFILPRDRKGTPEKSKDAMSPGDRVMLHEDAMILSRFRTTAECEESRIDPE
jgi:glycine cleavage system T protein